MMHTLSLPDLKPLYDEGNLDVRGIYLLFERELNRYIILNPVMSEVAEVVVQQPIFDLFN